MVENHKVRVTPNQVEGHRFKDLHEPVIDFSAPTQNQIDKIITFMELAISNGMPVGVSCGAGIGRTGTILACYLVSKGFHPEQAIEEIKRKRGADIETDEQKKAVREYSKRLQKQ